MSTFLRFDGWVKTALGQAVAGAAVFICDQPANVTQPVDAKGRPVRTWQPTPQSTIFADVNGLIPITQPIMTDGFGHYDAYIASGAYTIIVMDMGKLQQVYLDQVPMGGTPGIAGNLLGDVTGPIVATVVGGLQTVPIDPTAPTNLQVLQYHSSSGKWVPTTFSGSGTVTSVAMTGDGTVFNTTVPGSPITAAGILAPTLRSQFANKILAGPASVGSAAPTFRSLVAQDIPDLSISGDVTGSLATSTVVRIQGTPVDSVAPTDLQVLQFKVATGKWEPSNPGSGSGSVTSVAMTGDGVIFNTTIGGSPITTAGTLVPALLTQSANFVLAGPTSGGALAPTFRALVAGDIPSGTAIAGDVTGTLAATTVAKIQGTGVDNVTPTDLQVLQFSASTGKWEPTTLSITTSTYYMDVTASDIATYFTLTPSYPDGTEHTSSASGVATDGEVLIAAFASPVGSPSATQFPMGQWLPDLFLSVDSLTQGPSFVIRVYKRSTAGVETQLWTTTQLFSATATTDYEFSFEEPVFPLLVTDRLVVKVFLLAGGASSRTATLYYDGSTHPSHIHTPASVTNTVQAEVVNAQVGTSYNVVDTDRRKLITFTNGSSVAVTLPQAGASNLFLNGWFADLVNEGAGLVTITPTTSTIDGLSSITLKQFEGIRIVSDGTNYFTVRGRELNAGTVTSVAMTGDGTVFNSSVTGSPITSSGTLAPSLATHTANTVFAGPTTGGAVAPTFRALVAADIPNPAGDVTGTYAATVVSSLQTRAMSSSAPNTNDVISWTGSQWAPTAISGLPNANASQLQSVNISSTAPIDGDTLEYVKSGTNWAPDFLGWHFALRPTDTLGATQTYGYGPVVGNLATNGWSADGSTAVRVSATSTELYAITQTCTASAGVQSAGLRYNSVPSVGIVPCTLGLFRRVRFRLALGQSTNTRVWIGLTDVAIGAVTYESDTPNTAFVGFRFSSNVPDTKYQCVTQTSNVNSTKNAETTATHVDTSFHNFDIVYDGTNAIFYIDGTQVGSQSGNMPAASQTMGPSVFFDNVNTGNTSKWSWAYIKAIMTH